MEFYDRWLSESRDTRELLRVYTSQSSPTRCNVGCVINSSTDWILMAMFDLVGKFDGYHLIRRDDIFLLQRRTRTIAMLQQRSRADLAFLPTSWMSCGPSIQSMRQMVPSERLFCSVWIYGVAIMLGFIVHHDEHGITLHKLEEKTVECDGEISILWEDIARIVVDSKAVMARISAMGRIY